MWQTYEEVYQKVMRIGSAIRSLGVEPVSEECLMSLSMLRFYLHPENACQYENSFVKLIYAGSSLWHIWIQLPGMGYGHAGDLILFYFIFYPNYSLV